MLQIQFHKTSIKKSLVHILWKHICHFRKNFNSLYAYKPPEFFLPLLCCYLADFHITFSWEENSVMGREKLLLFFLSRFAYLIIGANNCSTVYNLSQIRKKVLGKECSGFDKKNPFDDKFIFIFKVVVK